MAGKEPRPLQPRSYSLPAGWLDDRLREVGMERKAFAKKMGVTTRRRTDWINGSGILAKRFRKIHELLGSLPDNLSHLILPGGLPLNSRTALGKPSYLSPSQAVQETDFFTLCGRGNDFFVLDGDGVMSYSPLNIHCRVDPTAPSLPPEVLQLRRIIEEEQSHNRKGGRDAHWNGPQLALTNYAIFRSGGLELPGVTFTFAPSDYFTFLATVKSIDRPIRKGKTQTTLRELYVPAGEQFATPVPFMAHGFGVVLVLVTKDEHVLLQRRASSLGARAQELDVSVVEAVHPEKDSAVIGAVPDLYRTAVRGCVEEAGVEVDAGNVRFLGFGVDRRYYQWNILGLVRTDLTARQAAERRSRGISGKWEARSYQAVAFNPISLFQFLLSESMWSTAWCALYWSLVNYGYSPSHVYQAAESVFLT